MGSRRDTRRRFEQCARKRVALREGLPPSMGQSPFAIFRSRTFEQVLFHSDAPVAKS
jgi:hypothetical protein